MNKLSHIAFILLCISASVWFLHGSKEPPNNNFNSHLETSNPVVSQAPKLAPAITQKQTSKSQPVFSLKQKIFTLLERQFFSTAVETFNTAYDELDDSTIQTIQSLFYQTAQNYLKQTKASVAEQLTTEYLKNFQDEQAYILLARSHVMQSNYRNAIDAAINAYGLSFDSSRQKKIEQYTVQVALSYYAEEQKKDPPQNNNDSFSDVLQTLTRLHYLFPENARLTYEIANLLRVTGNLTTAQQYLSNLIYANNDYSEAAGNLLNAINQQQSASSSFETSQKKPTPIESSASVELLERDSIVVPLKRSGSSYLVDVVINRSPVTLLLDTGASITALSEQAIDRLNLDKTRRKVRLSTANGTRTSNIFRADSLQLNGVQLNNVAVVQIELGRKSRIDGLLGTDVLQQFNYQIDNQTNSLILSNR